MTPADVLGLAEIQGEYSASVCRLVESQEEAATYSLVNNLDEQALLEQIIDDFKPAYPEGTDGLHYLIKTPFRYPPLRHGSRFGTRLEASFFYASEDVTTCYAEVAFYRFVFFEAMDTPYQKTVHSSHQLFSVAVQSSKALDLTSIEDEEAIKRLTSKTSYEFTQAIGRVAHENSIELIRYRSARSVNNDGKNVAIDQPYVITTRQPESMVLVQCETLPYEGIVRFSAPKTFPITFRIEQFMVEDKLPYPPA
ncbi:RES family NAD+ phosphorylase [Alteromonas sp. ASW11-130]|uniref:RES family NAD+ phosphorylase n=1 Tax=Alteromonas sp. ASW11-130 TaxID=3015775 RepID=UPI002241B556|nr:RES family NAD+ phosphorylase [Alteromonas sp. ASW11-130]MCW8090920.1 RES family NAD+ phosphorylase [Alteromonas sp. ASW11-130]